MGPSCLWTYVSLRTTRHIRTIASASADIDSRGVRPCQFQIDDRGTHTPHPSCEKPHVPVYTLQRRCEGVARERVVDLCGSLTYFVSILRKIGRTKAHLCLGKAPLMATGIV